MGIIITIGNNKGGSCKTNNAYHFTWYLRKLGYKVLGVDFDLQGNYTKRFFSDSNYALIDYFEGRTKKLVPVKIDENFDILPSARQLGSIEKMSLMDIEIDDFDRIKNDYDFIIIDTPPATLTLFDIALNLADITIIPIVPEPDYIDGMKNVVRYLEKLKTPYHILLTRIDGRVSQHKHYSAEMRKIYGNKVLENVIGDLQDYSATYTNRENIFDSKLNSRKNLEAVYGEILKKEGVK